MATMPLTTRMRSLQTAAPAIAEARSPGPAPLEAIDNEISDEDLLVSRILEVFTLYKTCQERTTIEKIWRACIVAYRGMKPSRSDPMKDSMVIKEIFRQMHTLKPQINKQFFSQPQLFKYSPMTPGADESMRIATQTVHYQIRKFRHLPELKGALWCKQLFGTSYLQPGWQQYSRFSMKAMKLQDPDTGSWWKRKTTEVVNPGPSMEFIPPNEIYSDPRVPDVRNSAFVFRNRVVSGAYLKTRVREGYLDAQAIKQVSDDGLQATTDGMQDMFHLTGLSNMSSFSQTLLLDSLPNGDVPHTMLELWTTYGMCYVVIDEKILARAQLIEGGVHRADGELEPGPIPLFTFRNYPQIKEHWGIPEPYTIIDDQYLLNELYTMFRDALGLCGGPQYKATTQGGKALANYSAKPGGIIWVQKQEDVQILPPMQFDKNLIGSMGFVQNNMKQLSGLSDNLAGQGDQGADTASMGIKLLNAATVRIEDRVEDDIPMMEEVYLSYFFNNNRNLSSEMSFSLPGPAGVPVFYTATPEHFNETDVGIDIQLADAMESDPEANKKWINTYQVAGKDPLVDRKPILKQIFRTLDRRNPDMYMSDPSQTQSLTAQENRQWEMMGYLDDPKAEEDQDIAIQIHQYELTQPAFMMADPYKRMMFKAHLQKHVNYKQAQMMAQGQAASASPNGPMPGGGPNAGDTAANNMMGMAATGAAQQGAPPPSGPPAPPPGPPMNGRPPG